MSAPKLAIVLAGLAGTFALLSKRTLAGEGALPVETVRAFADSITRNDDLDVDVRRIVRIAWIESAFNPSAVRFEPRLGDSSVGLMQTLVSTARWLAKDMGYRNFGVPNMDDLLGPQASIYFGGAYLEYLSRYGGKRRGEEWIVRSYNGGPGHSIGATTQYWRRYNEAKARFG